MADYPCHYVDGVMDGNSKRGTRCGAKASHEIMGYFIKQKGDASFYLCPRHVVRWRILHPFDAPPTLVEED